jgi:hypothetical protein
VVTQRGDYRDLFTSRKTFLTPLLSSVYGVPMRTTAALGEQDIWQAYEYPEGDPRAGLLTQVSFVSLHSHPGRTSPTLRGRALREILLCEKIPDPPANVNFTVVQDTSNPLYKTTRERLSAHRSEPMCAGCHKLTDPMGLALENFDSAGGFRATENGKLIDTSGTFSGGSFSDAAGLGKAIHDYPGTTSCLVDKLYAYGVGRTADKGEAQWIAFLKSSFAAVGYRIPDLLRLIATSEAFYRIIAPDGIEKAMPQKLALETRQ